MSVTGPGYEIILRQCIPSKTEQMSQLAKPLGEAFAALDRLSQAMHGKDDHSMELTHALADILRGYIAKTYGVDFCPTNELGPHEEVELPHSLTVLVRLVNGAPAPTTATGIPESVRQDLCRCFHDLERQAYLYREQLRNGSRLSHPDELFAQLERNLAKLRTNEFWVDSPQTSRPAPHMLA